MHHPAIPLPARPARSAAGLIAGGILLTILGGLADRPDAAMPGPAARHGLARAALDHLDGLRAWTARLGDDPAITPPAGVDAEIGRARAALGADMIALREAVAPGSEETGLRDTLAALARYQARWTDARDRARSDDPDGARRTLAAASPLGERATTALASLGHIVDDTDAAAEKAYAAAERWHRLRNAGLALLAAGVLLLWTGRPRNAGIELNRA